MFKSISSQYLDKISFLELNFEFDSGTGKNAMGTEQNLPFFNFQKTKCRVFLSEKGRRLACQIMKRFPAIFKNQARKNEKTTSFPMESSTSSKNILLQMEHNFVLSQSTKIHHTQCISRKFLLQILCSSIHIVFGCVGIQGDAKADFQAQNGTDVFSLIQLFVTMVLCCDFCTNQSNGMRRFCNQAR